MNFFWQAPFYWQTFALFMSLGKTNLDIKTSALPVSEAESAPMNERK